MADADRLECGHLGSGVRFLRCFPEAPRGLCLSEGSGLRGETLDPVASSTHWLVQDSPRRSLIQPVCVELPRRSWPVLSTGHLKRVEGQRPCLCGASILVEGTEGNAGGQMDVDA